MATPKIITINDLRPGKLTITRSAGLLTFEQRYDYRDAADDPITELGAGRVLIQDVDPATLPPSVVTALQTINDHLYAEALAQEGMT